MFKSILGFILLKSLVAALPQTEISHDDPLLHKELTTALSSERPLSNYEVTEIIIDIPDNRTRGPIITNFTISRPLNTVATNNGGTKKVTKLTENEKDGKKNYVSIYHVKAEFEDRTEQAIHGPDSHHVTQISVIKNYLHNIKQGIIDGFKNVITKHKVNDDNFDGPLGFINKLHKKSTDAAHKFHDAVFGLSSHEHK